MTIVGGPLSAVPDWYHAVGTLLALGSGLFIGVSLILQKKGLLDTEPLAAETGNEHAYLKSRTWWLGMLFMAIGELSNLAAYAFSPAIIVTPLGAVSVIVSAILSVFFLNEKLNFSGVCGLILCIIGSTIIVFHGPTSTATQTIPEFYDAVLRPGFICYAIFSAILLVWLVVYIAPLYGKTQPVVYLSITSIGGAFLVNAAQGFGSSIVYTTRHWEDDNQFRYWGFYPLTAFIGLSAVFQIHYLNLSLLYFSNSIVTPVNYVFFASFTIITSAVLYQGFNDF
ncbi:magnesium transporter [Globomyces pollinis-pini]|nr:magnesium transporter [Globomyces pollinis-pini]